MGQMFRLRGGHFDYGADISTVGWTFRLRGVCIDVGMDHFDCGVCAATLGWTFRLQGRCFVWGGCFD